MQLREITISEDSLNQLDAYAASFSPAEFLQSSKWLVFQQSLNKTVKLFAWEEGEERGWFTAYKATLPLGYSYYYIPRGPIVNNASLWPVFLTELKKAFSGSKNLFIRFEPDLSFKNEQLAEKSVTIQPQLTLHTDLSRTEEEMLAAMHQKTRYNIRLGLKKKLEFRANDDDFESFWKLMRETAQRDKFASHPRSYYEGMIKSNAAQLATIRKGDTLLAAGIFFTFNTTLTYAHGASSSAARSLMAPYVLHWEMMRWGGEQDFKTYDWHGIDEKKWPGFTRFKKGFGGREVRYPGTFDVILAPLAYRLYNGVRYLRRLFPRLR